MCALDCGLQLAIGSYRVIGLIFLDLDDSFFVRVFLNTFT
jgi:hypothetical protein